MGDFDWTQFLNGSPDDMSGWLSNGGIDGGGLTFPPMDGGAADQPGPGGLDSNDMSANDYQDLYRFNADLGDPSADGGGLGQTLSQIARALGLSNGSGLGGLAGGLLPILASLYSGNRSRKATEAATAQARADLAGTQSQIGNILNGAGAGFKPYTDAGASALQGMQAFPQSNLAANYKPIGSGRGLNLAQIAKG